MALTAEQLHEHNTGIGGTDAAVIAGCHPYKTERELYHEKRGEIEQEDISDKDAVYWGNVLEDTVAIEFARRTGNKVHRVNKTLKHPDYPFIIGHIDRNIAKTDRALECKTASAYISRDAWGPSGTDQVPEHYLIQCQHYMGLLPKVKVFDLAVLIGGNDFRMYEIPRDDNLIRSLVDLEVAFWDRVGAANAPEFDYSHESTIELIQRLYPGTDGQVIELPAGALHWHEVLTKAKEVAKTYESVIEGAKAHLQELMGQSAVGLIPGMDGAGYTRKLTKRKSFTVEATEYIDFRFTKKPKGVK